MRYWAIAAVGMYLAGPLCARLHLVPPIVGFAVHLLGGALCLCAVIAGIALVLLGKGSLWPPAVCLAPAVILALSMTASARWPMINDISTNLESPPILIGPDRAEIPFPAGNADVIRETWPSLKALRLHSPPDQVFAVAQAAAAKRPGWTLSRTDKADLVFQGVATEGIFQFSDDFVVRVRPDGEGCTVDMRSRSRVGKGDLGANARRIEGFLRELAEGS